MNKEYTKEYYKRNKERILEYRRSWRLRNKDKQLEYNRKGREKYGEKNRISSREFYWNNKQKELDRIRLKKYGITGDEFRKIVEQQGFVCPICGRSEKGNLSVDHDHKTGRVRGIICNSCNMALGNVEDSPDRLRALANYLDKNHDRT